ncbi:MAG TPA: lysophospholipid acyltransferase family protein [Bryobacteraceae bacterium]|jgi:KDO2-lipid IV(A) lauroyltransferase|nr:lysophospholipid acyltransferase family protein [Bryobacteraceae bacterium]
MRTRSAVRNRAEYGAALVALKTLEWAPLGLANRLSRLYARLFDAALPRLRRVGYRNLAMAMPEMSAPQRKQIVDGVFGSIARVLVAFAKFPSIRRGNVEQWIRCEGREHVEEALRQGRGVLFATAHLGNWELSAYAFALLAEPMDAVVRPLDNPLIDALVERRRGLSGNRAIGKQEFARAILKALADNRAVGILADQNSAADGGVFVDFFGVPACAPVGLARLAGHSGAAVIPGFAIWEESEKRYVLRFRPPITISGDAERDTQVIQSELERAIREHPDQWLWIHRRWKTRPPGEASLY